MVEKVGSARRRTPAITLATWLLVIQGSVMLLLGGLLLLPFVLKGFANIRPDQTALLGDAAVDGGLLVALGLLLLIIGVGLFFRHSWSWLLAMTMQGVNLAVALASYFSGDRDLWLFLSMVLGLLLVLVLNQHEVRRAFQR
ncbi:MAG TPA: hypothetical protein VKR06_06760 [Ktedonosporobacter sp.]|nr:hypothetical protein [Ktedonosporobacter sp.]